MIIYNSLYICATKKYSKVTTVYVINQHEGMLAYKVINGTFLLNDSGIKSNLEILVT